MTEKHTCDDEKNGECEACSVRDCPQGEPLHYHHDGCPSCDIPRAYTEEEVRNRFLDRCWTMVRYWETQDVHDPSVRGRLSGLLHSLLVTLDGGDADLPGFTVIPHPHILDASYHESRGWNWYPDDVDIAGCLHELMYQRDPLRKK